MTIPPSQTDAPGEAVPAAADRSQETGVSREAYGRDDVGHAGATRDEGREPIDRPVPDPAVLVVGGIARAD